MDTSHKYWRFAERLNGRLAMAGLICMTVNYGLFGWVLPPFF